MKILIVEDDHRIAQAIQRGLEQEKGFIADAVYDGQEGFDLASTEPYDCIILDRMLPGMDGMEFCRSLRAQKIHIPILMLTAKSQTYDKVEGLTIGADDYLTKPFSFDELLARIRALARRPATLSQHVYRLGDLIVDTTAFTVARNNTPIMLSQKEFALLSYLIKHPHTICSKEHLIEHVWNFDADILPNTVEAVIKNLRKKIDLPFDKPLVHTIRGFGYKLTDKPNVYT
jgi:two-component system, OmpR family, response regulator